MMHCSLPAVSFLTFIILLFITVHTSRLAGFPSDTVTISISFARDYAPATVRKAAFR